jgi:hypothetical protein
MFQKSCSVAMRGWNREDWIAAWSMHVVGVDSRGDV